MTEEIKRLTQELHDKVITIVDGKYCIKGTMLKILLEEALKTQVEKARREAYEEIAKMLDDKANDVFELLKKADTATAVSVFQSEMNHWKQIANAIRSKINGGNLTSRKAEGERK